MIDTPKAGDYLHTITTVGMSSHDLGKCAICGKHATEMFYQKEKRYYTLPDIIATERGLDKGSLGLTEHNCFSKFGHKECLEIFASNRKAGRLAGGEVNDEQ